MRKYCVIEEAFDTKDDTCKIGFRCYITETIKNKVGKAQVLVCDSHHTVDLRSGYYKLP